MCSIVPTTMFKHRKYNMHTKNLDKIPRQIDHLYIVKAKRKCVTNTKRIVKKELYPLTTPQLK
jgi:hypothetical protein